MHETTPNLTLETTFAPPSRLTNPSLLSSTPCSASTISPSPKNLGTTLSPTFNAAMLPLGSKAIHFRRPNACPSTTTDAPPSAAAHYTRPVSLSSVPLWVP